MAKPVKRTPALPKAPADAIPFNLQNSIADLTLGTFRELVEHAQRINESLAADGSVVPTAPLPLQPVDEADLPDATLWEGAIIWVDDLNAFAYSDGTEWIIFDGQDPTFDSLTLTDGTNTWTITLSGIRLDVEKPGGAPGGIWVDEDFVVHDMFVSNAAESHIWTLTVDGSGDLELNKVTGASAEFEISEDIDLNASLNVSGSATFAGNTRIDDSLLIRGTETPAAFSADQDDLSTSSAVVTLRWSATTPVNVTGISNTATGNMRSIHNVGANNITLVHESASSTAANRFALPDGTNIVLGENHSILIWYDTTSSRWRKWA